MRRNLESRRPPASGAAPRWMLAVWPLLLAASITAIAARPARAADDVVKLRPSGSLSGTVSGMTATELTLDMPAGAKKQVPVADVDSVTFAGEPPQLKLVRSAIASGNFENALATLEKIDAASVTRAEIKQDLQFYKAFCLSRMALRGSGSIRDAGKQMQAFVNSAAANYHFFQASETLGDLFVAIGAYDKALGQYNAVDKAPWPAYKQRAGVAKGRVLVVQKKYPEALAAFEAVLAMPEGKGDAEKNDRLTAQLGKATCLAATGQPEPAIKLAQDVVDQATPEDVELNARGYVTLGNCYSQKPGGTKEALLAFLHVDLLYSANREAHAEALARLAKLWNEVGKPERAAQATQLLKEQYAGSVWAK